MKKISPTFLAIFSAFLLLYVLLSHLSDSFIDPFLLSIYSSPTAIESTKTLILNGTVNAVRFNHKDKIASESLNINVVLPPQESELVVTQYGTLDLNISGLELSREMDPLLFESNELRCLKISVELTHFSSRSNIQNIFVGLPIESSTVVHSLRLADHFQFPQQSQSYRAEVSAESGFCLKRESHTTQPDPYFRSQSPEVRASISRLFYLIFVANQQESSQTIDSRPAQTSEVNTGGSSLQIPALVAITSPLAGSVTEWSSVNVSFSLPVIFYHIQNSVSLLLEFDEGSYDISDVLRKSTPPDDLLEQDLLNWDFVLKNSPDARLRTNDSALAIQQIIFSFPSIKSFVFRNMFSSWIELKDIPRGRHYISLKAFLRNPSRDGYELVAFDSTQFESLR